MPTEVLQSSLKASWSRVEPPPRRVYAKCHNACQKCHKSASIATAIDSSLPVNVYFYLSQNFLFYNYLYWLEYHTYFRFLNLKTYIFKNKTNFFINFLTADVDISQLQCTFMYSKNFKSRKLIKKISLPWWNRIYDILYQKPMRYLKVNQQPENNLIKNGFV